MMTSNTCLRSNTARLSGVLRWKDYGINDLTVLNVRLDLENMNVICKAYECKGII